MKTRGNAALVTGGGSGIGLALAQALQAAGNRVIIAGRRARVLEAAAAATPGLIPFPCDIAEHSERQRLIRFIAEDHPDLNILVNNAAIQFEAPLLSEEISEADVAQEIAVNLTAPVLLIKNLVPTLANQPEAALVNVSSVLAVVPKRSSAVYCATKAGLRGFSRSLRLQLAQSHPHIRVFELLPPLVETAMTAGRGSGKIPPAAVAQALLAALARDQLEIPVGKSRLVMALNRLLPATTQRILAKS